MNEEDLLHCLRSLDAPRYKAAFALPEKMPLNKRTRLAVQESQRDLNLGGRSGEASGCGASRSYSPARTGRKPGFHLPPSFRHAVDVQGVQSSGSQLKSPELMRYLHNLRDIQKNNLATRNMKSMQQRAYLEFMMLYYVRCQVAHDWHHGVQQRMLELFTGPSQPFEGIQQQQQQQKFAAIGGRQTMTSGGARGGFSTHHQTAIRRKSAAEENALLEEKRVIAQRAKRARQIRDNAENVLAHLVLIHAL